MGNMTDFDANEVDPSAKRVLVPDGDYKAIITRSERNPTSKGDGEYILLQFEILEGEYERRVLKSFINIVNPNPETVRIAKGQLSAICRAVGVLQPDDSSELHNIPLCITVGKKKRSDTGEMANTIKAYKSLEVE